MKNKISLLILAISLLGGFAYGQVSILDQAKYHVFNSDSLKGFDETAARASAISEGFLGKEFTVRMYQLKRRYINDKYNLWKPVTPANPTYGQRSHVVPACVNEDFENSSAGNITTSNQIEGWTVTEGYNLGTNYNSCNLLGCCPSTPSSSAMFSAPNGLIDPVIGNCYPIYSVFGDGPPNTAAAANNTHITIPMKGTNFIRINNDQPDFSMAKLSKTFSVTPSNALFQFAFITVFYPGHGCCDAGAFQIRLLNASNNNQVLSCPAFSASAPSAQCSNTTAGITFLATYPASLACQPYNINNYDPIFNKWQISSMDLTAYLGQNITIEVIASDCTGGAHYGYCYFDAQCGPMSILGNGVQFPAGTQNVTIPTCGPNGATICATPGLGPYSWAGPNIPPGYSTPSYTNQCFTTSVSSQYTLYMAPPGGCAPFTKIVNTSVTPAPTMVGSVKQAECGDTLAIASVTTGGSAGNPAYITWYPTPLALNGQTTQATYIIPPPGSPPSTVFVSAADQIGCPITITLGINAPAPIPHFSVLNVTGTTTLTCITPTIGYMLSTTYTYGPYQYFWSNNSFTSNASQATLTLPGSYTVTMTDQVSKCAIDTVLYIGSNTVAPITSISPTFQIISCATTASNVTLTAVNPSVNITQIVMSPLGGSFVTNNSSALYAPGYPDPIHGYTYQVVNNANGCSTTKLFTVTSNEGFPTFSLTSVPGDFTLGCSTKSLATIQIVGAQATPTAPGAVSFTLLPPGFSGSLPSTGTLGIPSVFTVSIPGTYTVVTRATGNWCDTKLPVSILLNNIAPPIDTIIVPQYVLSCFVPSIQVRGLSFTPDVNYRWNSPGGISLAGDSLKIYADLTQPTKTVVGTYTFVAQGNSNLCISTQTITIGQDLFKPTPRATSTGSLTCNTPTIQLSNQSNPNGPYPKPKGVSAILWEGPTPQIPLENSSSYTAGEPGTYTMTVRDENNGCITSTTSFVPDFRDYPVFLDPPLKTWPPVLDCGATSASLQPNMAGNGGSYTYQWTSPPGTGVSPSYNSMNVSVQNTGEYVVIAKNPISGCTARSDIDVSNGTLTANFSADKIQGFAPLTVNFENSSKSSTGSASITSVWVYGNNVTNTLNSVSSTSVTYNQPGTYTVTLFANKGSCLETHSLVINVDAPSEMKVPNVFTPNGDGVNDLFFLQRSANLTHIEAVIYDRWGNKVFEVTSEKGQIEWDGKNQYGKEVPTGTYYFIIKGEGKDKKTYDEQGTLTLIR